MSNYKDNSQIGENVFEKCLQDARITAFTMKIFDFMKMMSMKVKNRADNVRKMLPTKKNYPQAKTPII